MEKNEIISLIKNIEKQNARMKIGYWETVGTALLGNGELGEKWCSFVQSQVNNDFLNGEMIDETLQIISMIKSNIPYEVIAQAIKRISGGRTIIDTYLGAFIHPEVLYEIQSIVDSTNYKK